MKIMRKRICISHFIILIIIVSIKVTAYAIGVSSPSLPQMNFSSVDEAQLNPIQAPASSSEPVIIPPQSTPPVSDLNQELQPLVEEYLDKTERPTEILSEVVQNFSNLILNNIYSLQEVKTILSNPSLPDLETSVADLLGKTELDLTHQEDVDFLVHFGYLLSQGKTLEEVNQNISSWKRLKTALPLAKFLLGSPEVKNLTYTPGEEEFILGYKISDTIPINFISFPILGMALNDVQSLEFEIKSSTSFGFFGEEVEGSSKFQIGFKYVDEDGNEHLVLKRFDEVVPDFQLSGEYQKVSIDLSQFGDIPWENVTELVIYFDNQIITDKKTASLSFKNLSFLPKPEKQELLLDNQEIDLALSLGNWDLSSPEEYRLLEKSLKVFSHAKELYNKGYPIWVLTGNKKILDPRNFITGYTGRNFILLYKDKNGEINIISENGDLPQGTNNPQDLARLLFSEYTLSPYQEFMKTLRREFFNKDYYATIFEKYVKRNKVEAGININKELLGKVIDMLPEFTTRGLKFIYTDYFLDNRSGEYILYPQPEIRINPDICRRISKYGLGTLAHEFIHHLILNNWGKHPFYDCREKGWAELSNIFYLINWKSYWIPEGDEEDFISAYFYNYCLEEGRGEDPTTTFQYFFTHYPYLLESVRQQMEEGRFKLAVKTLFCTYIIGFDNGFGTIYPRDKEDIEPLTFEEVKEKMQEAEARGIKIPETTKEALVATETVFNNWRRLSGYEDVPKLKLDVSLLQRRFPHLYKEVITYGINPQDLLLSSDWNLKVQGLTQIDFDLERIKNFDKEALYHLKQFNLPIGIKLSLAHLLLQKGSLEIAGEVKRIINNQVALLKPLREYPFSTSEELFQIIRNMDKGELLDWLQSKLGIELNDEGENEIVTRAVGKIVEVLIAQKIDSMNLSEIYQLVIRKSRLIYKALLSKLTNSSLPWLNNPSHLPMINPEEIISALNELKENRKWSEWKDFNSGSSQIRTPEGTQTIFGSYYDKENPEIICSDSFEREIKLGRDGFSCQITYDTGKDENNVVGFWMKFYGKDLTPYNYLVFFVKGDEVNGFTTRFKIRIKDTTGREDTYIVDGVDYHWRMVAVPLKRFRVNLKSIEEICLDFDAQTVTENAGTVYIDEIGFATELPQFDW